MALERTKCWFKRHRNDEWEAGNAYGFLSSPDVSSPPLVIVSTDEDALFALPLPQVALTAESPDKIAADKAEKERKEAAKETAKHATAGHHSSS
jgi:hypothetical protein